MKKAFQIYFFLLFSLPIFAQHLDPNNIPLPTADMPSWAKTMYEKPLNLKKINEAYRLFYQNNAFEKNKYTRFFKRLNKKLTHFVSDEGIFLENENLEKNNQGFSQNTSDNQERNAAGSWSCIGPKETFWLKDDDTPTPEPACPWQTNVYCMDVAPSNHNIVVIGAETGGLYKTIDKGKNWTEIGANYLFPGSTEAIAIHPTDPNTFYIGNKSQIIKTTDGGITLKAIHTAANFYPNAMVINPTNPNIIMATGDKGLLRSTDGGTTWKSIMPDECYDLQLNPTDANLVYALRKKAGTKNFSEFLKSTDGGTTFNVISAGWLTGFNEGNGRLAVSPANANYIYTVLLTENDTPKLMKSTDKGESWTLMASGNTAAFGMDNWQGYYDLGLMVSAKNAEHLITGTASAWKSTDGGKTFINLGGYGGLYPLHPDIQSVKSIGNDTWITTDGGMNYSADFFSSTPEARNNGITGADFWGFSQGWNEDLLVGGRYHNGNTAIFENFPKGQSLRMGGAEAGTGYMLHGRPRHVKYSDLGDGWVIPKNMNEKANGRFAFSKTPNEDEYGFNAGEIEIHPSAYNTIYLTEDSLLWKTIDGGISFESLYKFPNLTKKIELSRSNPKVIYLNTNDDIFKSIDEGKNFVKLTKPANFNCNKMSMSLNPLDENELWISANGGSNGNRIFKTKDGGKTWINLSTPLVANYNLYNVAHQAGTNGGVYVVGLPNFGGSRIAKVFYRNNTLTEWVDFSNGLPYNFSALKTIPFYKDEKLRIAGDRGIWESPFYEKSDNLVQLQPCVDKLMSICARDTFSFEDYSIYSGSMLYKWDFLPKPNFVSATNVRNPKVVFGKNGNYTATMTVNGQSKTLNIVVGNDCGMDTIPGAALALDGSSGTYSVQSNAMNLNSNTVTISAWAKADGFQQDFAAIFMARGGSTTAGLSATKSNELRYHWNDAGYGNATKMILLDNEWAHVAMVVSPTNVKIYMNGKSATFNGTIPAEAFDAPMKIGSDYGNSRNFNGLIDEVCVFNRSLTQEEIRELMHLTKETSSAVGLVAYYQFNEKNGAVLDRINVNHLGFAGNSERNVSTAPVGKGTSKRLTINTIGNYDFSKTGLKMNFSSNNTPNGEVCVSRILQAPNQKPTKGTGENLYYIVNNYGTNATFTGLSQLTFEGLKNPADNKSNYLLFKRAFNADGASWQNTNNNATLLNANQITFGKLNGLTEFGQFYITKENWATGVNDIEKEMFVVYPNPNKENEKIVVKTSFSNDYNIKFIDNLGRIIYNKTQNGSTSLADLNLSKGIYFYEILFEGKKVEGKLIVE